jgi:RNA polymerase sigma-70 factor (sigma-E family)
MRILPRRIPKEELDFAEFVRDVSPRLLRTAYVLGGSQDVAEDLVQEALERACARWHRIAVADAPEAYVRQIVVNLANDRWRRMGRARESVDAQVPDRPDPSDEYARLDLRDQLTVLLETLPIRMRTIIVLRYLHDMDDVQIAAALDITQGAVRSQLSRGLAKLRTNVVTAAEEGSAEEGSAGGVPADDLSGGERSGGERWTGSRTGGDVSVGSRPGGERRADVAERRTAPPSAAARSSQAPSMSAMARLPLGGVQ